MAIKRTISIIKPDAVEKNIIGKIYSHLEESSLRIIAAKMEQLSEREAEGSYAVHRGRPFYEDLVKFMTRNPVMIRALEGENAVARNRELMGVANPTDATPSTIRADFAESVSVNAVHGSGSVEDVATEIVYFFSQSGICPR